MFQRILITLVLLMNFENMSAQEFSSMSKSQIERKTHVFENAVIAHRGSTFWTPEETEIAFRWARNTGADYLEIDVQRTKDGVLIALHDDNLLRTTNIREVYPNIAEEDYIASNFTYEELLRLDAGSWFNELYPQRSREEFSVNAKIVQLESKAYNFAKLPNGVEVDINNFERNIKKSAKSDVFIGGMQYISSLEDVIMISKGWMPARDKDGKRLFDILNNEEGVEYVFYYVKDPKDNGNRPGIYIETKEPNLYPGIEKDLYDELQKFGYLEENNKLEFFNKTKVNTGNTKGAIVLQTFSLRSLAFLNELFKDRIPITLLLWVGDANMPNDSIVSYSKNIEYAIKNGASFIGPSIGGEPNNYNDLLKKEHAELIRKGGLGIHAYSFDTEDQFLKYFGDDVANNKQGLCDSFFSNRSEININLLIKLGIYNFKREPVDGLHILNQLSN